MKMQVPHQKYSVVILVIATIGTTGIVHGQIEVSAGDEEVTASTSSPLTEATLDGSVVILTLAGRSYVRSIFDIRDNVTVSGITGITVDTFDIDRESDTEVTVELTFNGDIDTDATLTFTVGAGAIAAYNGAALAVEVSVTGEEESVDASTTAPLTEATLDGSVVTLTLTNRSYARSIFDVRRAVTVTGIDGVTVGTFDIDRISDTQVTVELTFNGDFDTDATLTFRVEEGGIENYNGPTLTARIPVTTDTIVVTNQDPVFSEGTSTIRSIAENIGAGQNIGSPVSATDGDGDRLTYSLQGTDAASFDIVPATGQLRTRTGVTYDYETKNRYSVRVLAEDARGGSASISVTVNLTDINETELTAAPDLVVQSPSVSDSNPDAGESFSFSATVRNQGTGRSPATTLQFYQSADATLSTSDTEVESHAVSGLAASGSSDHSIDLAAPSGSGTYYYGACVESVSDESNTGNNCSSPVALTVSTTVPVTPEPPPAGEAKLYWSDWGTDKIQRADLDGSNTEDLVANAGLDGPDGLSLDFAGGKIYWTDAGTEKIQRADLDGSNVEDLISTGLGVPYGLDLDMAGGKIYWTNRSTSKIQRADLDGSNVEDLLTLSGLAFPGELAVDAAGGKIYWTNAGADKIQRADLDGSNVEDLVTSGLNSPNGLALDATGGKIYWTDRGTDKIQRADLDGSNIEDLVASGLTSPNGLALDLDGGKIYWTDVDADKIQRANLDGSNIQDLLTSADGLVDPSGITLGALRDDGEPVPPSSPCASGAAVPDAANNPGLVADCEALLEARDPLAGTEALNWSARTPISSWTGVTLRGTPQRVTKLRLWNLSLNGTIPSELSRLNHLEALYLAFNQLRGTIPAELGNLTGLTHLGLINNQLTGAIPPELARLTNLRQLSLQDNRLTGAIPAWVGSLTRLEILNLQVNQLTGTIPAELGNLTDLWQLLLFENQLTGAIPAELGSLTNLQEVALDDNQLTGAIPSELADLTELTLLHLAGNQLSGCIPPSLRDIANHDMDELGLADCAGAQTATADFNGDGTVDFADFFEFVDAFGGTDPHFDLDGSGIVDFGDFFVFADAFVNASVHGAQASKLVAMAQEMIGLPAEHQLQQNAPNPFNSETVISWFLREPGPTRVEVFSLTGQRVAVLQKGSQQAGYHRINWDARDDEGHPLASGVYLYRLVTKESVKTRNLIVLR